MIKSIGMNNSGAITQLLSKYAHVAGQRAQLLEVHLDRRGSGGRCLLLTHGPKVRGNRRIGAKVVHSRAPLPVRHTTGPFGRYLSTMEPGGSDESSSSPACPTVAAQEAYFQACPHKFSSLTG